MASEREEGVRPDLFFFGGCGVRFFLWFERVGRGQLLSGNRVRRQHDQLFSIEGGEVPAVPGECFSRSEP